MPHKATKPKKKIAKKKAKMMKGKKGKGKVNLQGISDNQRKLMEETKAEHEKKKRGE